jgi:hypothetical protein
MAGVGIACRVSPTIEKRGIHWAWLLAPVVGVLIFFTWLYTHLGTVSTAMHNGFNRAFFHFGVQAMNHSFVPGLPPAAQPSSYPVHRLEVSKEAHENRDESKSVEDAVPATNDVAPVYCTGYCAVPGCVMVFLSDGRIARQDWGDVQYIRSEKVGVFGSSFPVYTTAQIAQQHPEMYYQPKKSLVQTPLPLPSSVAVDDNPSPVVVNPVHDYRENLHDIRSGSFSKTSPIPGSLSPP